MRAAVSIFPESVPGRRPPHRRVAAVLGLLLLAGVVPAGTQAASPTTPGGGLLPTIHYEDAAKHANDRIDFAPGRRVEVAFTPRGGDRWSVDGATPRRLPAGRQSGRAMREAVIPGLASDVPARPSLPRLPDDRPIVDPATITRAQALTWGDATELTVELAAAVDPGALRREVFGFLPYWELTDASTKLDWEKISTVAYFGVGADGKGNLIRKGTNGATTVGWSGWTSARMTNVIEAAHRSHARVVLTVQSFAWTSTGAKRQKALLGSAKARANLARQITAAVRDRGADGVNLDFEPLVAGYADEFTALVRKVRSTLKAAAPGYQLTFDTTGWIGNYPIEAATKRGGADAIFIMGYDYRSASSNPVGSIAPIGGPTYDIRDTIMAYLDRVPASKLILGVPYYGRAWSTSSSKLGSKNISGTKYGPSATAVYANARAIAAEYGRKYDATQGVAWTAYKRETCTKAHGCVKAWRQLYYDDARALKAKYDLVNGYGLRGIGIWALGYDGTRPELYQAIKDKFITDTVPPVLSGPTLSPAVFSPDGDGLLDVTTARVTATGLVRWGYVVYRVSGTTLVKRIRSGTRAGKAPAMTWDGRNADGRRVKDGTYRITLWAADVSDNRSEQRFTVRVDTRPAAVTSAAGVGYFSPDGDRQGDTIALSWSSTEAVTGTARIRNAAGASVRSWALKAKTRWSSTWTGKDKRGRIVPDGRYIFRIDGRDAAGNRTVVDRPVLVDRTIKAVRWTRGSFDPRGRETSRAVISVRRSARITVAIYRGTTLVRAIWSDKAVKAGTVGWSWNGRTSAGAYVKPGTYRIIVTANSKYGTTRFGRSVTVEPH
jgi:spore germination protein YaaH/flagellar hook assembly protein FlgD